jgi:hypothetical protein
MVATWGSGSPGGPRGHPPVSWMFHQVTEVVTALPILITWPTYRRCICAGADQNGRGQ